MTNAPCATVGGQDKKTLGNCSSEEKSAAINLSFLIPIAALVNAGSVGVGCSLIGASAAFAGTAAALSGLLTFFLDRNIMHDLRVERGRAGLDELIADGRSVPRRFKPGLVLRFASAGVVGATMGTFMGLAAFESDTTDFLNAQQDAADAAYLPEIESRFDFTVRQQEGIVASASKPVEALASEMQARRDALAANAEARKAKRAGLLARSEVVQRALTASRAAKDMWDRRASCEDAGIASDECDGATGRKGQGDKFDFAVGEAGRANNAIVRLTTELTTLDSALTNLPAENPAAEVVDLKKYEAAQAALKEAQDDYEILLGKRSAYIESELASQPGRVVYDPKSLFHRIRALGELMGQSWHFAFVVVLIKVCLIAAELMALFSEVGRAAGTYNIMLAADDRRRLTTVLDDLVTDEDDRTERQLRRRLEMERLQRENALAAKAVADITTPGGATQH